MSFVLEAAKSIKGDLLQPFGYQIINFSGKAVYIEGFLRVINISAQKIEFLHKKCRIIVEGDGLGISVIEEGAATIEGDVRSCYVED